MDLKQAAVYRIRAFNRLYMPALDLLGNHYLGSEYSAAEARVFFEIYQSDGCHAAHIAKTMNIDKSYLSRIIKSHEKNGDLCRLPSAADGRVYELHLTEQGRRRTEDLISRSNDQIADIVGHLDEEQCARLTAALDTVTELLLKGEETS